MDSSDLSSMTTLRTALAAGLSMLVLAFAGVLLPAEAQADCIGATTQAAVDHEEVPSC